ncbi:hypothetical protein RhiirA5_422148 [Rhizophagus irregularis]|uniref:Uncharacterized protein n=2 Tax=Rhizophagus irregularis TaxID=588596 RepID=A0A2N0RYI8_9GLOM|nr:hypothetical protein RhiirA5_422148 [Rhizophagus irregularis]PKC68381.1 hypothetical protein RhiirA1_457294 [Rhizophagus irregularis]UZO01465.1 hypothetical protein OCT59_012563 [Rhizophagus irregularis]UZO03166.1 hypothetical protein OCT59_023576 [Rhizophagus irregularis]UZO08861.1 hypothetical protein OCT59_029106 [Rhizophagus irregularis]
MDISTDQLFKEKGDGLTQEKYEKIIALQQKHDAEIQMLSDECQLELAFIKSIMKDNREPAPKKTRSISSWNTFQTEWFKKNKIKVTTPGAQKQCAEEYALLNKEQLNSFKNRAEELSENRFNKEPKLIESIRLRKAELNKQICEIRKLYRTLQITCDVEFLTLVIPLSKELNISYFGTPVGEEFYKSCLKLDEIHNSFYHFSCLKKSAKNEIIKQVTFQKDIEDITMIESADDQLSIIDKECPNSKNARDKVRKYLQEKFNLITKERIPYKNWYNQTKYTIIGWPEDVLFCNYSDLSTEDKKKILSNLNNIYFKINNLSE